MSTTVTQYGGWAIDVRSARRITLVGRYWWFGRRAPEIPRSLEGHHIALFKTRREARAALPWVKRSYPRAKVKRVRIDVVVNEKT